jgi:hypothetical protein
MKKDKQTLKTLRKINRKDPALQVKPSLVQGDRRTKRNRTRATQNKRAIDDSQAS